MLATFAAVSVLAGAVLAADEAPWPSWLALPANLGAVALLLWLQLTGKQYRREDALAMVAVERERGDERVADCEKRNQERLADAEKRYGILETRLDAVVADRNAWREAHHQEVQARATAEAATTKLLSATDVTVRLLDALERSVVANQGTRAQPPQ